MTMTTKDFIEASGMIAVVAGLLLVAYQINQATQIATAQARAEFSAGWRSVDSTRQSENFSEVLAKSIYRPGELKPGEILELDAYYTGVLDQIQSAKINWETGIRSTHWQSTVDFLASSYFGNEFSRSWWNQVKEQYARGEGEEFVAVIDAALDASDPDRQKQVIDALHAPSSVTSATAQADDADKVTEAVRKMFEAFVNDDIDLFRSVTTPDFYSYDAAMEFDGDELMKVIKQAHAAGKVYVWEITEPNVRVVGDTAWIWYVNRGSVTDADGKTERTWLESAILRKEDGIWRIQFLHSTPVPAK